LGSREQGVRLKNTLDQCVIKMNFLKLNIVISIITFGFAQVTFAYDKEDLQEAMSTVEKLILDDNKKRDALVILINDLEKKESIYKR